MTDPKSKKQVLNVEAMIEMSGGNAKFAEKFIPTFETKTLNESLNKMHDAWPTYDVVALEAISHKAKGASS